MSTYVFFIPALISVFLLLDLYVFSGIKTIVARRDLPSQRLIFSLYWGLSVFAIFAFVTYQLLGDGRLSRTSAAILSGGVFMLFFTKLTIALFLMVADIKRLANWVAGRKTVNQPMAGKKISRSAFLVKSGLIAGAVPFGAMSFGILSGAYDYRIIRQQVKLKTLPRAFHGLRIVQLSDIHSGSFYNKKAVRGGVEMALNERPDLICFTGDLVNNRSTEMKDYMDVFEKLRAPLGVYSILGNHDYGHYANWRSETARKNNMAEMYRIHKELNWRLLRNEHILLKEGSDSIAMIGVENWGKSAWMPKLGDMQKAMAGTEGLSCKILLSHDPSHWDHEVISKYSDISLTLSGHTHGMQFGVEAWGVKWSPVKYFYPRWAGLYEVDDQQLYVNRGFGFLAFPGRIGMPPEITLIELS